MREPGFLHCIRRVSGPNPGSRSAAYPLIWLLLLLAAGMGLWSVLTAHRARVRGMPLDFPPPVREADVPALGVNVALDRYRDQELAPTLATVADDGFVWIRQSFCWSQVDSRSSAASYDWSSFDRILTPLRSQPELEPVAVLMDDPPMPPDDPDRFAAFAGAFARRYGERIDYYQIWDEPNLASSWGGGPVNPSAYADLLARAACAIRAADPGASILLAGLAPTTETGPQNLSEIRYLERLYQVGAAPSFDVVAAKLYGFDTGPEDRRVDESRLNLSRVVLLREVMVKHGDAGKAIWATQWGWNALPVDWAGAPSIWGQTDEATQAAWSVKTLGRAREEWPWMGAMIIETLRPDKLPAGSDSGALENPRWGFGLVAPDGNPRPVYRALGEWARSLPAAAPVGGYVARNPWATYGSAWRVGPLAADPPPPITSEDGPEASASTAGERATFRFEGTRVAMTVRRGPYRAFLYVTVDDEPANALPRDEQGRAYVVLHDKDSSRVTVPLATGLKPGTHRVDVVAEGGQGQWPLMEWRVGPTPVRGAMLWKAAVLIALALVSVALLVRDVGRVRWSSLAEEFLTLPGAGQVALTAGSTGVLWSAAAFSWGHLMPLSLPRSSCFIVSVLILPVLIFLFATRPDLNLMLVAFAAPLYLVPDDMFYRALSLPEVLVVLGAMARAVRWLARRQDVLLDVTLDRPQGQPGSAPPAGATLTVIDVGELLLILAALVASVSADDHAAALFELRSVLVLPVLYYAFIRTARVDRDGQWRLIYAFLAGGVVVSLIGLGQAALGQNLVAAEGGTLRLRSVYHSPNSVALYLGRVWPFLAALALWGQKGRQRALALVALVPVTVAIGLTSSRGALLLALPASVLVLGWRAGARYRWVASALVLAGAVALIPLLRLPRFAGLLDPGAGTTFFRLELWRSSLRMIGDHPLLGVGPGNFLDAYRTRYVLPAAWEEFNLEHAHNILLDHWTRLGLLGLVAGLVLQIGFWRYVVRWGRRDAVGLGLVGGMAALLAHGAVDNAVFFPDLALTFFLMLALAQEGAKGGRRSFDSGRP